MNQQYVNHPIIQPHEQANETGRKKPANALMLIILIAAILLFLGGGAYVLFRAEEFVKNIDLSTDLKNFSNDNFRGSANINSRIRNTNNQAAGNQLDIMLEPEGTNVNTNAKRPPPCLDSDAHLKPDDIYVKGIIKDSRGKEVSADQCADSRFVIETECQPDDNGSGSYAISSTRRECPTVCNNGACVIGGNELAVNSSTNQAPKIPSVEMNNDCLDSDAGLSPRDIYSPGGATLSKKGIIVSAASDSCRDNSTIEEVKCRKGTNGDNSYYLQRIPYPCPKGCLNGACEE